MRVVRITNTNLFRVAGDELGDATKWIGIAELNDIKDPFIGALIELKLPIASDMQGGGIVGQ
jgi:hypothetical protein